MQAPFLALVRRFVAAAPVLLSVLRPVEISAPDPFITILAKCAAFRRTWQTIDAAFDVGVTVGRPTLETRGGLKRQGLRLAWHGPGEAEEKKDRDERRGRRDHAVVCPNMVSGPTGLRATCKKTTTTVACHNMLRRGPTHASR